MTYDFNEYKKLGEPEKKEKAENWEIAIGLQQVDGLTPSEYLFSLAKKNIEGDITIDEVKECLRTYYEEKPIPINNDERKDEADKVSAHIAEILNEKAFTFSPVEYINIHRRLFDGVFIHAGAIRNYNITKDEWVLNGDTVLYASFDTINKTLDYDFEKEKKFVYKGLSGKQIAEHIAEFTIGIWQIHPFCEGNTRTTAVFIIKYLRNLGFKNVSNNLFAENSWYFRNALVRAAATNVTEGVFPDRVYLDRFFGNLLLGQNNILRNREMHIYASATEGSNKIISYRTPTKGMHSGKFAAANKENATVNNKNATVNGENATVKLSATQIAVLEILKENKKLTAENIAKDIGKDISTIKRAIKVLREKGMLERIGSDKTGYWKCKKGGDES